MGLEDRIAQYVACVFEGYQPSRDVRDVKAIHEPLLGTNLFYRHEVAVLDTPLLQRLRHIHQTGLAFLTFPLKKDPRFIKCAPHEILSYLIVRSAPFKKFFQNHVLGSYSVDIKLDKVANMIIGYIDDRSRAFITHIINGSFDADKLDYISRDGYFTGLRLVIDIDSLFYRISVNWLEEERMFGITPESPNPGEQILFSKMLLFSTIYNHQKVRASDCMLRGLAEYVNEQGTTFRGSHLVDPVDFLVLTDNDIFGTTSGSDDPFIKKMITNLSQRNLFKRALVIGKGTVDNWDDSRQYELPSLIESPDDLKKLRQEIFDSLPRGQRPSIHEIWIDLPQLPEFHEEATQTHISVAGAEPVVLQELFPVAGWLEAYADRQWRGHVFCPEQFQGPVNEVATTVLREYGLELNHNSRTYCHL